MPLALETKEVHLNKKKNQNSGLKLVVFTSRKYA